MKEVLKELFLIFVALLLLLSGCASNSALTLMRASQKTEPLIPDLKTIEQEFKGRSFYLNYVSIEPRASVKTIQDIPADFFGNLIHQQVLKAFKYAKINEGKLPSYPVVIFIEQMKFTRGMFLIPDPSILRIKIELHNLSEKLLLQGSLEARYLPTTPIFLSGSMTVIPTAFKGQEWEAVNKMIPAIAVATTKIVQGLQLGQELEQIKIYPDAFAVGGRISPDIFLKDNPYGLTELTSDELLQVERTPGISTQ